ncbi:MAG: hypothetical protein WB988_21810, partial [Candidatus Nitrosopolaris sp.]
KDIFAHVGYACIHLSSLFSSDPSTRVKRINGITNHTNLQTVKEFYNFLTIKKNVPFSSSS